MADPSIPNPSDPSSPPRLKLKHSGEPDAHQQPEELPPEQPVELSEEADLAEATAPLAAGSEPGTLRRGVRRLALILVPGLLLAGVLLLLNYLIQPFAGELAPIAPPVVSLPSGPARVAPAAGPVPAITTEADPALQPATAEAFLERLAELRPVASENPRGVFISSVFYPENAVLHPGLGLIIERVEWDGAGAFMRIRAADGASHQLPVQPPQ